MSCKTILLAAFFASASMALAQDATSRYPDGTGDPDATTCRPPMPLESSRMLGPKVCKTNSQWALLRKNGQDISADGSQIIPDPKNAKGAAMNCTASSGGASNGGGGMPVCH
jgi:hypothetical protein